MRNDDGMGRGMKGQAKVLCQCVAGHCFLEEDGARARQNYADATSKSGFRDTSLLNSLENQRLRQKEEWMENLGVFGICEVCCRKETSKQTPDHQD